MCIALNEKKYQESKTMVKVKPIALASISRPRPTPRLQVSKPRSRSMPQVSELRTRPGLSKVDPLRPDQGQGQGLI